MGARYAVKRFRFTAYSLFFVSDFPFQEVSFFSMNVCLLNDSFPPVIDGVVNVVMNYANYLHQDHGCEVVVGTPYYPDTAVSEL